MSDVIQYNPTDPTVPDRVTSYQKSVSTPDWETRPNTIINPTISAVLAQDYWKYDRAGSVVDMSTEEQTAVDEERKATEDVDLGVLIAEPRDGPPANPSLGWIYCSKAGTLNFYDGTAWKQIA